MNPRADMIESILIVDDEESIRRTFVDWLSAAHLRCEVHAVADAESALLHASRHSVDLAILDWNLGQGADGLQLLEDLAEFHPDIVAIMVTGFAHQATPLDALRMGVRDYLDKNQDLNRETFLAAVRRQLDRIIPAKRQRQFNRSLFAFREAVEKVLPLVQSSAAMNDPAPLPEAIRSLFRFLLRTTGATDGVLVARHMPAEGPELFRAFASDGNPLDPPTIPFAQSLAASVVSMQAPCSLSLNEASADGTLQLQPFERDHRYLLAAPIQVAAGTFVVLELFDRKDGLPFSDEDRSSVATASEFSAELLRQAMSDRQTRRTLFIAVEAALQASQSLTLALDDETADPPSAAVLERLKEGLSASANSVIDASASLRLAEAVRVLALRHGESAVKHCTLLVENLRQLLDEITGV